ncbi:MAG: class I SAM-dependent methyltransferase [Pseudonocardia sp.]
MKPDDSWLDAMWPFVRDNLPASPATVLEIGCGPLGGFVPMLRSEGYDAVGVDPEAPNGHDYQQTEFERHIPPSQVDVVVASTSLHHVRDLGEVLDAVSTAFAPGGTLIVLEWASERFDAATAQWCFERLPAAESHDEANWLQRHRDHWQASDQPWDAFFQAWLQEESLHPSDDILRELDLRFEQKNCRFGPYCFPALPGTTMDDEQMAIDENRIQATAVQYTAVRR